MAPKLTTKLATKFPSRDEMLPNLIVSLVVNFVEQLAAVTGLSDLLKRRLGHGARPSSSADHSERAEPTKFSRIPLPGTGRSIVLA